MEQEVRSKVVFHQMAAKMYGNKCPGMTSYFGSVLASSLKKVGVQPLTLCPYCSTPFSPLNTSTRTLTRHQLKTKRRQLHVRGLELYSFVKKSCRSYVVNHCKCCHRCSVVAGCKDNHKHTSPRKEKQVPYPQATPTSISLTTPRTSSSSRKKRCGLKAILQQQQSLSAQSKGISPKLTDFLTSLQ